MMILGPLVGYFGGSFKVEAFAGLVVVVSSYHLASLIYNILLHPLRHYPGPKLWAASRISYAYQCANGTGHTRLLELHQKYGDIVRVAPDELSFSTPEAWKDLLGRRKSTAGENGKDQIHYAEGLDSVLGAPKDKHARFRRILNKGFSNTAMLEQEAIIKDHVDSLFKKLHVLCHNGPIDMVQWFDFVALDIITDLGFGESFHCLHTGSYHAWAQIFLNSLRGLAFAMAIKRFSWLFSTLTLLSPRGLKEKYEDNVRFTNEMVLKRLAEADRPDFIRALAAKEDENPLTLQEIQNNAQVLTMAGFDTTATALAGVVYLITSHPNVLVRLTEEVRSSFQSEDEIGFLSTQSLTYMTAVMNESLRVYPPAASGAPRQVPVGGDVIFGRFIPEGTVINIWQWVMNRNPRNFLRSDEFIPERWLGDQRFDDDKKDAFQPFSYGPRNCLGRHLAHAELYMIISRLVWNFDLELDHGSSDWMTCQKLYLLWKKGPLNIKLKPRQQGVN